MALLLTCAFAQLSVSNTRTTTAVRRPASICSFGFSAAMRGKALSVSTRTSTITQATPFIVEAKQNSLRRQRVEEKARLRNKARRSAIRTRMKKVFSAIGEYKVNSMPSSEAELKPVEKLISEAYQEIDKAVVKGVLHINTAARRKQRLAVAKQKLLIAAKLYTPSAAA